MSLKFYIDPSISFDYLKTVDLQLSTSCGYQKTITTKYILYESYNSDSLPVFNKIIKDYLGLYILKIDIDIETKTILEPLNKSHPEA